MISTPKSSNGDASCRMNESSSRLTIGTWRIPHRKAGRGTLGRGVSVQVSLVCPSHDRLKRRCDLPFSFSSYFPTDRKSHCTEKTRLPSPVATRIVILDASQTTESQL